MQKLKATISGKVDIHLCHRAVDTKAIFVGLLGNKYLCCHGDPYFVSSFLSVWLTPSRSFLINTVECIKYSIHTNLCTFQYLPQFPNTFYTNTMPSFKFQAIKCFSILITSYYNLYWNHHQAQLLWGQISEKTNQVWMPLSSLVFIPFFCLLFIPESPDCLISDTRATLRSFLMSC